MKANHNSIQLYATQVVLSKTKVNPNNESKSQRGGVGLAFFYCCQRPKLIRIMKANHNVAVSAWRSSTVVKDQS